MAELNLSADAWIVIGLLLGAVVLFVTEWVRPDLVAVLTAALLALTGVLGVEEALAGFGSEAVVAIASLLVIGKGLVRTGVVRWIAERLKWVAGRSRRRLVLVSTTAPGLLSGFINIVAAVSVFIPAIRRLALAGDIAPARLLMPMAYAGLMGANLSLIGASHNLVVDGLLQEAGMPGLGFFELTPIGAVLVATVVLYSLVLGRHLLPGGAGGEEADAAGRRPLDEVYGLADRLWQVWVQPDSPEVGRSLASLSLDAELGLSVLSLGRGESQAVRSHEVRLEADDVLLLVGRRERVERLCSSREGLVLLGPPREEPIFPASEAEMIEVVVPPRSPVLGRTLDELSLAERTGLTAVALWRDGAPVRTDVSHRPLAAGDGLLLYGVRSRVRTYDPAPELLWSRAPPPEEAPRELRGLAMPAALVFLAVLGVAAAGWAPVAVATLLGAGAMVAMGALSPGQAYRAIDWRTIVLIAGMLPMGAALQETGVAAALAQILVGTLEPLGPRGVLVGVTASALLLTQPLHNAAVAVMMTPVALTSAELVGADPRAFGVAVIVAASAKFLLPVGHPATLLVQEPGGYKALDYVRFGAGLTVLVLLVAAGVLPLLWPLEPAAGG